MAVGGTGIVYDDVMLLHKCDWSDIMPENPERLKICLKYWREWGLEERCIRIPSREATLPELSAVHKQELIELLKKTQELENFEEFCSSYFYTFINKTTYKAALLAAGSAVELTAAVVEGRLKNGFALVRPPGHHACANEFYGYCLFNNIAVAASSALNSGVKRILIVDWDIHHGQGTQRAFYEDPRVLYFSIHSYQYASDWPRLREGNYDYIGERKGFGYNVNVPLNGYGYGDLDYLQIFDEILLPLAREFDPELVLVSAGFDSAVGDPKGKMLVTPAGYTHLTSKLMKLANGKVVVFLEGGYCLESLGLSAGTVLSTLLGDPVYPLPNVERLASISDTIQMVQASLSRYWKIWSNADMKFYEQTLGEEVPVIEIYSFDGNVKRYPTRHFGPYALATGDKTKEILNYVIQETKKVRSERLSVEYLSE